MPVLDKLVIDLNTNSVACNGRVIQLAAQHAEILFLLNKSYPRAVPYQLLLESIWPHPDQLADATKSLQVPMSRLRKQIDSLGWAVQTVWKTGYKLVKKESANVGD